MAANVSYSISGKQLEKIAQDAHTYDGSDAVYKLLIDCQLQKKDFDAALKTAAKITFFTNADDALFSILHQAPQIVTKETAADKMNIWPNQDRAYREVVNAKLAKNDGEGAYKTALKINFITERDAALLDLITKTSDLKLAEKALSEMNGSNADKALEILVDRLLDKKDYPKALSLLSFGYWQSCVEKLFSKIFGKMEEKGLKKEDLNLLAEASKHLSFGKQKEILQTLANKYTSLGEPNEALQLQDKLNEVEERLQEFYNSHKKIQVFTSLLFIGIIANAIGSHPKVVQSLASLAGTALASGGNLLKSVASKFAFGAGVF